MMYPSPADDEVTVTESNVIGHSVLVLDARFTDRLAFTNGGDLSHSRLYYHQRNKYFRFIKFINETIRQRHVVRK